MIRTVMLLVCIACSARAEAVELTVGIGDQSDDAVRLVEGRLEGNFAEVYRCAFEGAGYVFHFEVLPQARMLQMLKNGSIDIGLPLVRSPERDEYAIFTRPVSRVPLHLFTTKDINLTRDLSAYTFAIMRSSVRGGSRYLEKNPNFEEVTSWEQALALARLGRLDGAVVPEPLIENLSSEAFEGLIKHDFGRIDASMYVSKKLANSGEVVRRLDIILGKCLGGRD